MATLYVCCIITFIKGRIHTCASSREENVVQLFIENNKLMIVFLTESPTRDAVC
jgi:hypothetical protein